MHFSPVFVPPLAPLLLPLLWPLYLPEYLLCLCTLSTSSLLWRSLALLPLLSILLASLSASFFDLAFALYGPGVGLAVFPHHGQLHCGLEVPVDYFQQDPLGLVDELDQCVRFLGGSSKHHVFRHAVPSCPHLAFPEGEQLCASLAAAMEAWNCIPVITALWK